MMVLMLLPLRRESYATVRYRRLLIDTYRDTVVKKIILRDTDHFLFKEIFAKTVFHTHASSDLFHV